MASLATDVDIKIERDKHNSTPAPLENKQHPVPTKGMHNKLNDPVSPKNAPRSSKWLSIIIFLSLLCLLALLWLVYEKNQINIQSWISNHVQWGTAETPDASRPKDAGSAGLQGDNINAFFQETEAVVELQPNREQAEENEAYDGAMDRELPPVQEPETYPDSQLDPVLSSQPELAAVPVPEPQLVPESGFGHERVTEPDQGTDVISKIPKVPPNFCSGNLELATAKIGSSEHSSELAMSQSLQIIFGFDSIALSPEDKAALDKIARMFQTSGVRHFRVTGYADERGDREYNLDLSRRRADVVAQYLVARGIDAEHLFVQGGGIYSTSVESIGTAAAGQANHGRIVQLCAYGAEQR